MKRQPSLHISEEVLIKILENWWNTNEFSPIKLDSKKLAKAILTQARKYTLTNRKINISTQTLEKKATKIAASASNDAVLFANILTTTRKQLRHRGVTTIEMGSRDWPMVKQAAALVIDFCQEFELEKRQGMIEYIKLALEKMKKFSLNKFSSLHEDICLDYQSIFLIREDTTPSATRKMHDIYSDMIYEKTGVRQDYLKVPQKYKYFVEAKLAATSLNVDPKTYILSQFEGLAWANGIPEPTALVGQKALERLNKYLYENKIKVNAPKQSKVDWSKIRGK